MVRLLRPPRINPPESLQLRRTILPSIVSYFSLLIQLPFVTYPFTTFYSWLSSISNIPLLPKPSTTPRKRFYPLIQSTRHLSKPLFLSPHHILERLEREITAVGDPLRRSVNVVIKLLPLECSSKSGRSSTHRRTHIMVSLYKYAYMTFEREESA